MKLRKIMYKVDVAIAGLLIGLTWAPAVASADAGFTPPTTTSATTTTTTNNTSTSTSSNDAARLQYIISKGDQEIQRRLDNLNGLQNLINSATKLTTEDKATLGAAVTSTVSGLDNLKTQLDSSTTLAEAKIQVQDMYTEYRVYVLLVPKVHLVKVADDQQVIEAKLNELAQKLQTRITEASSAGQNVSALTTELNSMTASIAVAQKISSTIESSVVNLQPSDYNTNHNILEGDNTQLATARTDNQAAFADAKQIISALKDLKTTNTSSTTTPTTK
ncbi:MAG TPA: hypothetical protein VFN31_02510 [Candidatus Saccharimonadales bacterium]|nr:hypothetical protein [Candidatus Saccharimonadales bacterium]